MLKFIRNVMRPESWMTSIQSFSRTSLSLALMLSGAASIVIGATSSQGSESLVDALKSASRSSPSVRSSFAFTRSALAQQYSRAIHGRLGSWDMVQLLVAFSIILSYNVWRKRSTTAEQRPPSSGNTSRSSGGNIDYGGPDISTSAGK